MRLLTISDLDQLLVDKQEAASMLSYDLAVIGFGQSMRHRHLLSQLNKSAITEIIAIKANEAGKADEPDNKTVNLFKEQFNAAIVNSAQAKDSIETLAKKSVNRENKSFSIFVDVSCLFRKHMGDIFSAIKEAAQLATVKLSVGYCLARYSDPPGDRNPSNIKVSPVHPIFSGWTTGPYLPVDVIVALGYEKGKALGAVEYLEPKRRWIFVPHSPETEFLTAVEKHNQELFSGDKRVQIDYEVLRPCDTYFSLQSLVVGILSEARPVLLPFGPRIFFAISLLVAMIVEEVSVWHVDGDDDSSADFQEPSGYSTILSCSISC